MGVQNFNLEAVKSYIDAKNVSYEIYSEFFDSYGDKILFPLTHVGIELTPHAWFWWKSDQKIDTSKSGFNFTFVEDFNLFLHFRQRYNRNTGGIIKSFPTGWNAQNKIMNFLNK